MPTGNTAPGLCELATVTFPQLSVAAGAVHVATWSQDVLPGPVDTLTFEGQPEITGGVSSVTITSNEQVLELLCPSVNV